MGLNPKPVFLAVLLFGVQAVSADERPQDAMNPAADLSLERLKFTRERPLFTPSRRAPAPPVSAIAIAAPPPPPPAPPPHISLLGILSDANGSRAIVKMDEQSKNKMIRLGDEIGGWRVTNVGLRQLVISLDDRDLAMNLFDKERSPTPVHVVRQLNRVFEVNSAGVLRSHRVHHNN